jgi:poly-gamma-glutamate capsule biosynthesis protein CapA/YwtB (metallophosphatase superfamily)
MIIVPVSSLTSGLKGSRMTDELSAHREIIIEDFDTGTLDLQSYPGQDTDPLAWELNPSITWGNSPYSLKLYGNTWKLENIQPTIVDTGDVWQVSAYIASQAEIQGFGVMDSVNVLFYSFAGSEKLNDDEWIPVYQGCFPEDQWNIFQLPLADDWLATYGYLPKITSLVYVNDKDATSQGVVYFDHIVNITGDLPVVPKVSIDYTLGEKSGKSVEVQFTSEVIDPDSEEHDFYWNFGDGSTSTEQNPIHNFLVSDDHPYTVLLRVADATNRWGEASCRIPVDQGSSSFPVTLNFVGDIMLARNYEIPGGIIPTQGVEAIFEPTKPFLGDAADITIANLECSLTTYWQHHPTKEIYYKGSPANVAGLTYAGIDLVTLANNHIMDYLEPGMQETQSVLKENHLIYSGAGANSYEAFFPAFYSKSGVNFAFLVASDRTGQYNNDQPYLNAGYNKPGFAFLTKYNIKKQIAEVKQVSDLVVMEWHSGAEYSFIPGKDEDSTRALTENYNKEEDYSPFPDAPTGANRNLRHYAIDNGADLVICHHPHIIQGLEVYKGKLIAHSLGNFAFDLPYPETFPSMILNTSVDERGFYEFSVTPVYIDDFIPQRAKGELGLYILDDLARRSRDLDTYLNVDRENVIATVIMDTSLMITSEIEHSAELPLEFINGSWETPPLRLEKTGSFSSVSSIQPQATYQYRPGRETIWFGNMEDEGCTLWDMNNSYEVYCDTVAFAGERSIQHRRDANSPYNLITNLEHRIICRSDTLNYSLCGYIKTLNGAGVTIEVQYYQDREGSIMLGDENIGVLVNGTTPWTYYHHDLTIPNGTAFFDVRLNSHIPNSGTAYSWFDNVSLICWDDWMDGSASQDLETPNDYYFLQVRSDQNTGNILINYAEMVFDEQTVNINSPAHPTTAVCELKQNFPNPFNPETGPTSLSFNLESGARVVVEIFDLKGKRVKVLTDADYQAGEQQLSWDGRNTKGEIVGSGVYFYQLKTPDIRQIKKCILLRL